MFIEVVKYIRKNQMNYPWIYEVTEFPCLVKEIYKIADIVTFIIEHIIQEKVLLN